MSTLAKALSIIDTVLDRNASVQFNTMALDAEEAPADACGAGVWGCCRRHSEAHLSLCQIDSARRSLHPPLVKAGSHVPRCNAHN